MTDTAKGDEIEALVAELREASVDRQRVAWSRTDGGQEWSLAAILADKAADTIDDLCERLAKAEGERDVARAGRAEAERENKRLDRELEAALAGQIANVVRREEANAYGDAEHARANAAEARALLAESKLAEAKGALRTSLSEMLEARDRLLCYHARTSGLDHGIETARSALTKLQEAGHAG